MTITQRAKTVHREEDKLNLTSGIQYNCDWCHQDITHTVRIKCAAQGCEEVDMCPSCFCKGREGGKHKAWHDYRVVEQHSYPIFEETWGADEELLLIEGLTLFGLGNWQDAAEHVGTRTRDECERHYRDVWVGAGGEAEGTGGGMETGLGYRADVNFDIDADTFQQRKKRRIEDMRSQTKEIPSGSTKKPLVSGPVNHEIGGFMPGRLDFEHEVYMDDAEDKVKDMEFGLVMAYGGSDQPEEAPPAAPTTDDSSKAAASSRLDSSSSAAAPSLPTSQAPRPPPPPEQTPSALGTPAGSSPTKMDVDEPDHEDEDEDDEDDFPSQPAAKKQPPPGSSGTPVPGTSHRGLSSGAGKKAASNKGVAAGGGGGAGTSKKTMHPPSSLPKHILMAQQRSRSASDSPTPEPETASVASTMSDPDVPLASSSSSKTLPPGVALPPTPTTPSDPLALTPVPPKPPAPPAAPPMNLVTDAVDYPEDADDLELKLAVLRIYNERLDRRREVKNVIFSRALTEHKRIVALERKRPQKEKDLIQKHKVFAKLQTAEDYEVLIDGLVYEQTLRARIAQLQTYRSKGISTILDAERYESQLELRNSGIADVKIARGGSGSGASSALARSALEPVGGVGAAAGKRTSVGPEEGHLTAAVRNQYTAATGSRKPPAPLSLASAESLHLLSPSEQVLCSTLRILPKPYLMIKETLIREYARRGGQLRRREARGLIKVDVNKTSKIWDLLVEMGCFRLETDPSPTPATGSSSGCGLALGDKGGIKGGILGGGPSESGLVGGQVDPALLPFYPSPTPPAGPPPPLGDLSGSTTTTNVKSPAALPLTLPPPPLDTPPLLPLSNSTATPMEGVVKTEGGA